MDPKTPQNGVLETKYPQNGPKNTPKWGVGDTFDAVFNSTRIQIHPLLKPRSTGPLI